MGKNQEKESSSCWSEKDYVNFIKLGAKLGIPTPQVHITLEVSENGKIIKTHKQRSRTWNRNFWNLSLCLLAGQTGVVTNFGAGYLSFKTTAGSVAALTPWSYYNPPKGIVNNSDYGIQAGTGTQAVSFEGYGLWALITHGTGAGQMNHAAHAAVVQNYVAGTKTWTLTLSRALTNLSGSTITIGETGLTQMIGNGSPFYQVCRDHLAATVPVNNTQVVTITYNISLTFPA